MKIKKSQPPNIEEIRIFLTPPEHAVFCYGDTIYNPSGRDIQPDTEFHESIHERQQGIMGGPEEWWHHYLIDPEFRLDQELEAYGHQYAFAQEHIRAQEAQANREGKTLAAGMTNLLEHALDSMATALSGPEYGSVIGYAQARSRIRNFAKNVA